MSDEARKKILERRTKFVAAALASVAVTASCDRKPGISPEPCLSVPISVDSGATDAGAEAAALEPIEPPPQPCLSALPLPQEDAGAPTAPPMPCLKVAPPPKDAGPAPTPQPCLTPVAPK